MVTRRLSPASGSARVRAFGGMLPAGCTAYLLLVVAWSLVIPFDGAPDERSHFFLVEYLYAFGGVPLPGQEPLQPFTGLLTGAMFDRDTFWYYGMPNLHALGAWLTAAAFAPLAPSGTGFLAARMFNWLLAPAFLAIVAGIARSAGLSRGWAIVVALCIALVPNVTYIFTYLNSDAFGLTVAAGALLAVLRAAGSGEWRRWLVVGVGCGLILCTKVYYVPMIAFIAILAAVAALAKRDPADIRGLALGTAVAAIVAAIVLGLTYRLYGDAFGLVGQAHFVELAKRDPHAKFGMCFFLCDGATINVPALRWWLSIFSRSLFYCLGWANVILPPAFYMAFFFPLVALLFVVSAIGAARDVGLLRRGERAMPERPVAIVLFWFMAAATVLANLIGQQNLLPVPQGRYAYVILPAAALMIGLLLVPRRTRFIDRSPSASRGERPAAGPRALLVAVLLGMAVTNALGIRAMVDFAHDPTRAGGNRGPTPFSRIVAGPAIRSAS